jgi:hypothetical protein
MTIINWIVFLIFSCGFTSLMVFFVWRDRAEWKRIDETLKLMLKAMKEMHSIIKTMEDENKYLRKKIIEGRKNVGHKKIREKSGEKIDGEQKSA